MLAGILVVASAQAQTTLTSTLTVDDQSADAGQTINYTFTVTASANTDAVSTSVTLSGSAAAGVTVSNLPNNATYSGNTITFNVQNFRNANTTRIRTFSITLASPLPVGAQLIAQGNASATGATTGTQGSATVTVTGPPTANPDVATVAYRAGAIQIPVLNNDVAAGGGAGDNIINPASVVLSSATGSNGGTFSVNASGIVTFTPPTTIAGSTSSTSVSYTVKNSATPAQTSNSATITVTVTNALPAVVDGVNAVLVNTAAATVLSPSLRGNDGENDLRYYTITGGLPTTSQGVLAFNGTPITAVPSVNIPVGQLNLLTFDPALNYVGRVILTFNVTDGGSRVSAPTTYTIPVAAAGTISGIVYEDANYGGGSGRSQAASGSAGVNGATVELYNGTTLQNTTTTATIGGAAGSYLFSGVGAGTYTVRVVNRTVPSNRAGYAAGLLPVQTYVNSNGERVGGETPTATDAAAGTLTGAQSVQALPLAASGAAGSDFGFSFDVVVNANESGQGSLRQFISNAAALSNAGLDQRPFNSTGLAAGPDFPAGQETSIFMLADGTARPGLRAGLTNLLTNASGAAATTNSRALITLTSPLVLANSANAAATAIDATTQSTLNDSNPIQLGTGGTVGVGSLALSKVNGPEVELVGATSLANLLQSSADNFTLRGVAMHGATNTLVVNAGTGVLLERNVIGITAFEVALPATATFTIGVALTNPAGIFRNNLVAYTGSSGFSYSGIGAGYLITNNEFFESGQRVSGGDNLTIADQVAAGSVAGPVTIVGNRIARSNSSGIQFDIVRLSTNTVQENTITENGLGGTTNRLEGSGIHYLSRNGSDRGTNPDVISRNIIINNQSSGIVINHGQRGIRISQNAIYQNGNNTTGGQGLLSVDLTPATYFVGSPNTTGAARYGQGDGVTPNDGVVDINQASGGMDYPIITSISKVGANQLRVVGYIGSNPAGNPVFANATVEVYSANNADNNQLGPTTTTSGDNVSHGEAQTFLGTLTANANGLFDETFSAVAATINNGDIITATAYLPAYGTSEAGVNLTSTFSVLPVALAAFEVTAAGKDAVLEWRTASEQNNDRFIVERALNGKDFVAVGTVQGSGTTAQTRRYSFVDREVAAKATQPVYYRLQQVDTDGTASYSPVRVVSFASNKLALRIYPNPAAGQAMLDLSALAEGNYQVALIDLAGRIMQTVTYTGGKSHMLDVRQLAKGTYIVLVRGIAGKSTQTLIIQ
ncbi:T9SS type A sorting domain-containing protein [Hymenobacter yonginensis]|uniref:T9SS type A sorting domain-containing protein n=2 Tax=Hymenobacter yonginensis TaxID=748197 RepID=A0ABY7PMC3_9BACT|nr:T9SS type A sorting domain-containing protein [Hymenobacter yonginensis]WBO83921.1 T9SS type A sorting domain-containing protein [Hymenobacter yonginensis]